MAFSRLAAVFFLCSLVAVNAGTLPDFKKPENKNNTEVIEAPPPPPTPVEQQPTLPDSDSSSSSSSSSEEVPRVHIKHTRLAPAAPVKTSSGGLNICTWNVFRFGPKKFDGTDPFIEKYKKTKIDMMVEQICNADILAMQEYFDPTLEVLKTLLAAINAKCGTWNFTVSERVGRVSKEQYVFLYRTDIATAGGQATYPEPSDIFSREPFFTNFKIKKSGVSLNNITLGTIHTEPKSAVEEMNGLIDTYPWAEKKFGNPEVMVLGDYNGDCQYVRKSAWPDVKLFTDKSFTWFIPTGTDTASMNSECTFDRAVVKSPKFRDAFVAGSLKVLDFVTQYGIKVAEARQLSDHFPVCLQFK